METERRAGGDRRVAPRDRRRPIARHEHFHEHGGLRHVHSHVDGDVWTAHVHSNRTAPPQHG